jgi:hypothetical protein
VTGAAGAAGTNGTNGTNGVAILHNDTSASVTTTDVLDPFTPAKTFTMTAGQLSATGDMIEVRAKFSASADNTSKLCYLYVNDGGGATQVTIASLQDKSTVVEFAISISRTGAATGRVDVVQTYSQDVNLGIFGTVQLLQTRIPLPLFNVTQTWANAVAVYLSADDNGGSPVTCDLFQVKYFKKQ